jgi:hypothetical protein
VGLWSAVLRVVGLREEPPNAAHLRAFRATLIDQRKAVAVSEAVEAWWLERGCKATEELETWRERLRSTQDAELRSRVRRIVRELEDVRARALAALRPIQADLRAMEADMEAGLVRFTVERQRAAAYGFNVSGFGLDVDEPALRRAAAERFAKTMPPEPPDDEREFLEELFRRRERCRVDAH